MTTHTKGPWKVTRVLGQRPYIEGSDFNVVASFNATVDEADLRLIAAAPELLSELKEAILILDKRFRTSGELSFDIQCMKQAIRLAEAGSREAALARGKE